jgi:hypothetical protein
MKVPGITAGAVRWWKGQPPNRFEALTTEILKERGNNPMLTMFHKLTRPVHFSIVMLLMVGYLMMGWMMTEQNRTITAQRTLIAKLFQDTVRLSVAQVQQAQRKR